MPFAELELGPFGSDELRVVRFDLEEAISRPFSLRVEFASEDQGLDLDALLGKPATFSLRRSDGVRSVYGIVAQLAQIGGTSRRAIYEAEIVPPIWLLSQTADCRIFHTDVRDIVTKVFVEAGLRDGDDFEFRLTATPRKREYCVQYRETDLDFVMRLLEDEGIFFFFEHVDGRCRAVFGDSGKAHEPIEGEPELRFATSSGTVEEDEQMFRLRVAHRIRPGAVRLIDYNFEQPTLDLMRESLAHKEGQLEIYDYPGAYEDPGVGSRVAQVRLEEARTLSERGQGLSNCTRLEAGRRFDLVEHSRAELNCTWTVVEVHHRGEHPEELGEDVSTGGSAGGRYSNEVTVIPHATPFRPPRVTQRPYVRGSQTAIVVGPPGTEIHCDEHSRVKVQFHWDRLGKRDGSTSCWVRVSQPWAGKGWGGLAIPRVGQEVIIDFLEGNPDQPILTGRVYNGDTMPPQSLPAASANMTIRSQSLGGTGGSNEITLSDSTGQEGFYVHAQYDMNQVVEHDRTKTVHNNETTTVDVDRSKTVGNNETTNIGVDRTEDVGANETITIGANRTEKVGANESITIGANQMVSIGGMRALTITLADAETIGLAKALTVGAAYQVSVGGLMNETVALMKAEQVGGDKSVTVGGDSKHSVTGKLLESAEEISLTGTTKITLQCGASQIVIEPAMITIKAPLVKINC